MQTGPTNNSPLPRPGQTPKPPSKDSMRARLDAVGAWWNRAWEQGGVLHGVWEDIRRTPKADWHGLAHWIKALVLVVAAAVLVMLLGAAAGVLGALTDTVTTAVPRPHMDLEHDTSGIWPTLTTPIRAFLDAQAAHLPALSGATVYTLWQTTGLIGLLGGFLRISGARILWTLWGLSSIWVVWSASPVGGRLLAAALAAVVWGLASILALRGLSFRPVIHNHQAAPVAPAFSPEFRPELHLHATLPAPTPPGDETPPPTVIRFPNR
ncbi:hypothetical protein [Streptomyces sp. TLI_105]|uniref:hypothetical protein n=1 Tax=Streptomyces sp. TLI_105 TaxID=1881019 RepID=UPI0008999804|nr:hypothetical protein [Streptomyces sp. TLI_105]SEE61509.1 hypothetical protein SAMN05428939_8153 [Streptomyces sp. TLI_105]